MNDKIFSPADILLPKGNFENWSVIACDQFTSRPDYWEKAKEIAGDKPSTYNLIFPEAFLETADRKQTIEKINSNMIKYAKDGIYNEYPNALIYVERVQSDGSIRCGLIGAVDLKEYDYNEGSTSKIRATEKTVIERIPPRVEIRKNAVTELPHILMLIDDPKKSIIEKLTDLAKENKLECLYDFDLMLDGGHIRGYLVPKEMNDEICAKVEALGNAQNGLTLAVGDGNHSLATAKACYALDPVNNDGYALVELVNIHSEAIEFEPIYRTVENCDTDDVYNCFVKYLERKGAIICTEAEGFAQKIKIVFAGNEKYVYLKNAPHALEVGTVQMFLDDYKAEHPEIVIDYIHGEEEVENISSKDNSCGFIYAGMKKADLFPAVTKEGVLPRKTFSMGHAVDKRYYTEARMIKKID